MYKGEFFPGEFTGDRYQDMALYENGTLTVYPAEVVSKKTFEYNGVIYDSVYAGPESAYSFGSSITFSLGLSDAALRGTGDFDGNGYCDFLLVKADGTVVLGLVSEKGITPYLGGELGYSGDMGWNETWWIGNTLEPEVVYVDGVYHMLLQTTGITPSGHYGDYINYASSTDGLGFQWTDIRLASVDVTDPSSEMNRNVYFLGFCTVNGTGEIQRNEDGSFKLVYLATTANASGGTPIFWAEAGVGVLNFTLE